MGGARRESLRGRPLPFVLLNHVIHALPEAEPVTARLFPPWSLDLLSVGCNGHGRVAPVKVRFVPGG
jgi:hypothetical protein